MSWFGGLFGAAKPLLPTTAAPPKNVAKNKNTGVLGENHTALNVAPIKATQLQAVPHPTAPQAGQQGGRRSVKGRKTKSKGKSRKTKGRKTKAKSRKTSK